MKKIFFITFILCSVVYFSYGQISWTTVQDNNYRVVPMTSVKSEILALSNLYQWFYEPQIWSREILRISIELDLRNSDPIIRRDSERSNQWLNSHQKFVYASHQPGINSIAIIIVNGNSVWFLTIGNLNSVGLGISTRNKQRLEQIIDSCLK